MELNVYKWTIKIENQNEIWCWSRLPRILNY